MRKKSYWNGKGRATKRKAEDGRGVECSLELPET